MKGSAITGPVGKEAAELWPVCLPHIHTSSPISSADVANSSPVQRIASNSGVVM
jgi:hypothetical protein